MYGPDQASNPRLADIVNKAKKAGFPKSSIEAAIARGQGKSATGKPLEALTIEAVMPSNIGVIIECESDNRLGHQAEINAVVKKCGGVISQASFLFEKRGRVMLDRGELSFDDIFEQAIEASALDVLEGDDDDRIVIMTEVAETKSVAEALSKSSNINVDAMDTDIVWRAKEDMQSELADSAAASQLIKLVDMLAELDVGLQSIYANAVQGAVSDQMWSELRERRVGCGNESFEP